LHLIKTYKRLINFP